MLGYLEPGEQVRLEERPHAAALARPLAWSVLLALHALAAVWRWDRTHLILTTDKLFVVHGIAQRRAAAVRLARVGPVEMEQTVVGRICGYGTVIAGDLEIPFVPDPDRVCSLAG